MAATLWLRGRWFEAGWFVGYLLRDLAISFIQIRAGIELEFVTCANFSDLFILSMDWATNLSELV
jgi:hypothetical protein